MVNFKSAKLSVSEENYLKAVYQLSRGATESVSTNEIAASVNTRAASVTDMMKKLASKELVSYEKYRGVRLSKTGIQHATKLIRRHRLWEVFLVEKLNFSWDQVHDVAEQLEHIESDLLIERLDEHLDFPRFDPHGDPIPNNEGRFTFRHQVPLSSMNIGQRGIIVGVAKHPADFLSYLDQEGLTLGKNVQVVSKLEFDNSTRVRIENETTPKLLSGQVCQNLLIKPS